MHQPSSLSHRTRVIPSSTPLRLRKASTWPFPVAARDRGEASVMTIARQILATTARSWLAEDHGD